MVVGPVEISISFLFLKVRFSVLSTQNLTVLNSVKIHRKRMQRETHGYAGESQCIASLDSVAEKLTMVFERLCGPIVVKVV